MKKKLIEVALPLEAINMDSAAGARPRRMFPATDREAPNVQST